MIIFEKHRPKPEKELMKEVAFCLDIILNAVHYKQKSIKLNKDHSQTIIASKQIRLLKMKKIKLFKRYEEQ